jgi:hypothetical protein
MSGLLLVFLHLWLFPGCLLFKNPALWKVSLMLVVAIVVCTGLETFGNLEGPYPLMEAICDVTLTRDCPPGSTK